ncbi:hypothetical protein BJ138DRAFT_1063452 [Hygrophoropsis aurantiaca]|uniref:Uncharacterized protein n=1 Tax=Hygrophoropsis aurantiaca TaxID=72124 RepID=A0ACB8ACQ7_9AGAM|nr:hypothetical protein BJ138DRAFT_1063452 [Hygrophoropsis aurantiaca]
MNSSSHRAEEEKRKQIEIRRKIKLLQAQLTEAPEDVPLLESPKRKRAEPILLAPSTPSPKKMRKTGHSDTRRDSYPSAGRISAGGASTSSGSKISKQKSSASTSAPSLQPKTVPSSVLSKLAGSNFRTSLQISEDSLNRSMTLAGKPRPKPSAVNTDQVVSSASTSSSLPQRDDRLAIIEDIPIGPADHKPPLDDPLFEHLEPNSGISLASRTLSHDDLQEYMRGRYYISPSRLYSSIRLLPNKQGYEVPVDGDWITIAVVAERGPIRYSRAPVDLKPGDDGCASEDESLPGANGSNNHQKGKSDNQTRRPPGKKYVNMKLIDFGARTSSSATGGKAVIRGDAFLSLLLFESDGFDRVTQDNGSVKKVYKGGSKGAFEVMSKLKEGDVIALLNPKVLKPFQRSNDNPHPTTNILAVTPESSGSIESIGRAKDLGRCKAVKKDGKPCGSWCDKRESDVCEWHLQTAVQRQRASRAEFSIGTSGMTSASMRKRKSDYDPARQWGLKPIDSDSITSTYIVSGHIVGKSTSIADTMGREGQAKAARQSSKDADRELKNLLDRDKEGMKAVLKAREVGARMERASGTSADKGKRSIKGRPIADKAKMPENLTKTGPDAASCSTVVTTKMAYSAQVIKNLGFDPAAKTGQKRSDDVVLQRKVQALADAQSSRRAINLAPRPGTKIRSGVTVPSYALESGEYGRESPGFDSSDQGSNPDENDPMVDLDGSDI